MSNLSPEVVTAIATIIGAVISGVVALIVSGWQNNKTIALIEYRLGELEEKVDKHNNLVERMYKVEAEVKALEKT